MEYLPSVRKDPADYNVMENEFWHAMDVCLTSVLAGLHPAWKASCSSDRLAGQISWQWQAECHLACFVALRFCYTLWMWYNITFLIWHCLVTYYLSWQLGWGEFSKQIFCLFITGSLVFNYIQKYMFTWKWRENGISYSFPSSSVLSPVGFAIATSSFTAQIWVDGCDWHHCVHPLLSHAVVIWTWVGICGWTWVFFTTFLDIADISWVWVLLVVFTVWILITCCQVHFCRAPKCNLVTRVSSKQHFSCPSCALFCCLILEKVQWSYSPYLNRPLLFTYLAWNVPHLQMLEHLLWMTCVWSFTPASSYGGRVSALKKHIRKFYSESADAPRALSCHIWLLRGGGVARLWFTHFTEHNCKILGLLDPRMTWRKPAPLLFNNPRIWQTDRPIVYSTAAV